MVRFIVELLLLAAISTAHHTKVTLIPTDPVGQVGELFVPEGTSLTISCVIKDRNPLGWLFNGHEKYGLHRTEERRISSLHTHSFDPQLHAGYYECYEDESQKSAAVRIYPRDLPLPRGYERCPKLEANYCVKGQCGIHRGLGNRDCFCHRGWSGTHCDRANALSRTTRH